MLGCLFFNYYYCRLTLLFPISQTLKEKKYCRLFWRWFYNLNKKKKKSHPFPSFSCAVPFSLPYCPAIYEVFGPIETFSLWRIWEWCTGSSFHSLSSIHPPTHTQSLKIYWLQHIQNLIEHCLKENAISSIPLVFFFVCLVPIFSMVYSCQVEISLSSIHSLPSWCCNTPSTFTITVSYNQKSHFFFFFTFSFLISYLFSCVVI